MKLYKIQFKMVSFYIFPFEPIQNFYYRLKLIYLGWVLHIKFIRLDWTEEWVWDKTKFCGSLDLAVEDLAYELTKNRALFPKARKLIFSGYERDWK